MSHPRSIPCPLCKSDQVSVIDSLTGRELHVAWEVLACRFSTTAFDRILPTTKLELIECSACGFQYFDTSLAGNGQFYAELQTQLTTYYPVECPSFSRAISFAQAHGINNVLDIGCGDGAFLDLTKKAKIQTNGIELNTKAAEICRGKGHQVYSQSMFDFARENAHLQYDLVTAFEVLEHVTDPLKFTQEAAQLAKPGGYIAFTVPNRAGLHALCEIDPHQWPPHHVTRWRLKDFEKIGALCGLDIAQKGGDQLIGGEMDHFIRLRNQIEFALGRRSDARQSKLSSLLTWLYRKTGAKFIAPELGASIYVFYQKPVRTS